MQVTLAKALKEKNKIVSNITELQKKIQQNNSSIMGSKENYNVKELYSMLNKHVSDLIKVKNAIHKANTSVYHEILELAEKKSLLKFLSGLNVQEGLQVNTYSETSYEYKSQITTLDRDKMTEEIQTRIEELQEKLDAYNHATTVEI